MLITAKTCFFSPPPFYLIFLFSLMVRDGKCVWPIRRKHAYSNSCACVISWLHWLFLFISTLRCIICCCCQSDLRKRVSIYLLMFLLIIYWELWFLGYITESRILIYEICCVMAVSYSRLKYGIYTEFPCAGWKLV